MPPTPVARQKTRTRLAMTTSRPLDDDTRRALAAVYTYLIDLGRKRAAGAHDTSGPTGDEGLSECDWAGRGQDNTAPSTPQEQVLR